MTLSLVLVPSLSCTALDGARLDTAIYREDTGEDSYEPDTGPEDTGDFYPLVPGFEADLTIVTCRYSNRAGGDIWCVAFNGDYTVMLYVYVEWAGHSDGTQRYSLALTHGEASVELSFDAQGDDPGNICEAGLGAEHLYLTYQGILDFEVFDSQVTFELTDVHFMEDDSSDEVTIPSLVFEDVGVSECLD